MSPPQQNSGFWLGLRLSFQRLHDAQLGGSSASFGTSRPQHFRDHFRDGYWRPSSAPAPLAAEQM